jgi:cytidylate kinase
MSNELRIAVSGKSGCGNTTVSRLLSQRLGIRLIN